MSSFSVRGSWLPAVVVGACAVLVLMVAPAHADSGDGYIEGLVVDEANDAPITAGDVTAFDQEGSWVADGVFTAEGVYRIGPVPAGNYRILFHDDSEGYQEEWWQDRVDFAEADSVVVTAGETTGGVVFMVSRSAQSGEGWIEGRLFLGTSGEALPTGFRLAIDAYDAAGDYAGGGVAWTGPGGAYRLPLPAGTHRLVFIDSSALAYESAWWPDRADFASADPVAVVAGEATIGVDWPLRLLGEPVPPQSGLIEGRLFLAGTGESLPAGLRFTIRAYDDTGSRVWGETAWTDSDGRYRVAMPAGAFRLWFSESSAFAYEGIGCPCTNVDGSEGLHIAWWFDQDDFDSAGWIEVVEGETTIGVDWPLRLSDTPYASDGFIEGRLTLAETGGPLPAGFRLAINAHDPTGGTVGGSVAWTDTDGGYRMALPAGVHRLELIDSYAFAYEGVGCPCTNVDGSEGLHIAWWPAAATFVDAEPLEVVTGEATSGVNFVLRFGQQPPPPAAPAAAVNGELPFGGFDVSPIAGIAVALLCLGGLLVTGARREELRSAQPHGTRQ